MLKKLVLTGVIAALTVSASLALEPLTAGPQKGDKVPGPFHPLNITGKSAGEKHCLYCDNGPNPVAVVFARELTPEVSALLKKLDEATVKNGSCSMGSYAVFMSDSEKLPDQLKNLADQAKLTKLILSIDNPAGPKAYEISKDAAVTVLLYKDVTVAANHSFKTGELSEKAITKVVSDVSKITK